MESALELNLNDLVEIDTETFMNLSYEEKKKEVSKLQCLLENLRQECEKRQKQKEEKEAEWRNYQKEYDNYYNKSQELSEKEDLINKIEDLDSTIQKVKKYDDDAETVRSGQSDFSLFSNGLTTTQNITLTHIRKIGRNNNVHFLLGKLPKVPDDVFIKVYVDPSYGHENDCQSIISQISDTQSTNFQNDAYDCLQNEVSILRKLFHDHIILYYHEIKLNGLYGYVMEYCKYGDLHEYIIKNGRMKEDQIRIVMFQMAQALAYLAENKIVHRDIKTANILIAKENDYKLCDFGSSTLLQSSARDTIIDDGLYRGTDVYMAPESGRGMQRGRSDIWSLGCCLYEMLTGELPWKEFKEESTSRESIVFKVIRNKKGPQVNPTIWCTLSPELQDLYNQCLQYDDSKRPTAAELLKHPFFKDMQ